MFSVSPPQRSSTGAGRKRRSLPINATSSTSQAKPSMLERKDMEGLSPQTPIILHVDLPEETAQVDFIPSVNFKPPPLSFKMLEPFDHFHSCQQPRNTHPISLKQQPELGYKSWRHFADNGMELLFDPDDRDSIGFGELEIPEGSFLFGVEQDELFFPSASVTREAPPIVAHTVPRELHRVLSSTTFEYNPVMRSLVFNIDMGLSPDAFDFECWIQSVSLTLKRRLPITDVLITVDTGAASMKGGDEADEAFLAVLWIISLLKRAQVHAQGLSLNLPPHLPVSQAAINMAFTRDVFNLSDAGSSNDRHLDCFIDSLSTLSFSGSLSLLNALIPVSAMHGLQILVIDDPQVSLDDVVILLKQAPKLISLAVGTLTDCYPALLPVYQIVASRSVSPDPALYTGSVGDAAASGSVACNASTTSGRFDSQSLGAGNVVNNKETDYPYLETLSLKYDATVCVGKLFENVKMSGLRSLVLFPMAAHL